MQIYVRSFLSLVLILCALVASLPASAQDRHDANFTVPMVGTGAGGSFDGTMTIQRVVATADGGLAAIGTLKGVVTNTATGVKTGIVQTVSVPVSIGPAAAALQAQQASCGILNLVLGPLHLDLL